MFLYAISAQMHCSMAHYKSFLLLSLFTFFFSSFFTTSLKFHVSFDIFPIAFSPQCNCSNDLLTRHTQITDDIHLYHTHCKQSYSQKGLNKNSSFRIRRCLVNAMPFNCHTTTTASNWTKHSLKCQKYQWFIRNKSSCSQLMQCIFMTACVTQRVCKHPKLPIRQTQSVCLALVNSVNWVCI